MTKSTDFWRAIEATFGMKTVMCTWNKHLGAQKEILSRYIRPTGRLADMYPCPNEFGCRFPHEVSIWKEDDIAAVPVDDEHECCRVYPLTREDVIEYEMNAETLLREAFRLLQLHPGELHAMPFQDTFNIGSFASPSGTVLQVYIVLPEKTRQFQTAAIGLLATVDTPFIFLSLTRHCLDTIAIEGLNRHKCIYLSMDDLVACDERGGLVPLQGIREILAARQSEETETSTPENVFRPDGAAWTMSYAGETIHLPDTKGFRYISLLLAEAGRQWSVEALLAAAGNGAAATVESVSVAQGANLRVGNSWGGHAGPVIDEQAKRQYRARLQKIEEEMEDAGFLHDDDRLAGLAKEKEVLQREILAAVGSQGKTRMGANEAEKASDAVSKAIRRATDLIGAEHPRLARHLRDAIKRGYSLSYEPESPVLWHTN